MCAADQKTTWRWFLSPESFWVLNASLQLGCKCPYPVTHFTITDNYIFLEKSLVLIFKFIRNNIVYYLNRKSNNSVRSLLKSNFAKHDFLVCLFVYPCRLPGFSFIHQLRCYQLPVVFGCVHRTVWANDSVKQPIAGTRGFIWQYNMSSWGVVPPILCWFLFHSFHICVYLGASIVELGFLWLLGNSLELGTGKNSLNCMLIEQAWRLTMNQCDLRKLKGFYTAKDTIIQIKR